MSPEVTLNNSQATAFAAKDQGIPSVEVVRFCWQADPQVPQDLLDVFEQQACAWAQTLGELQELYDGPRSALKYSLRMSARSLRVSARASCERVQDCAQALAAELNWKPPAPLSDRVEQQLGIPVLFVDMPTTAEGHTVFCGVYLSTTQDVIFVNRRLDVFRHNFHLACGLFQALTWDVLPPAYRSQSLLKAYPWGHPTENLAHHFAMALLMPQDALMGLHGSAWVNDTRRFQELAALRQVSPEALAHRLHELQLIDESTRKDFALVAPTAHLSEFPPKFSATFLRLLQEALSYGDLSKREALALLGISRQEWDELTGRLS